MNREKIRNVLELVGAAAIVISLGFVAFEIRQNTNAVRSTVIQSISQQSIDSIERVLSNPELRHAQAAVRAGNASEEQQRLVDMQFGTLLRIQMNRFLQLEIGVIDRDLVLLMGGRGGGTAYGWEFFIDYWERSKDDYPDDFQAYMEEYVLPDR